MGGGRIFSQTRVDNGKSSHGSHLCFKRLLLLMKGTPLRRRLLDRFFNVLRDTNNVLAQYSMTPFGRYRMLNVTPDRMKRYNSRFPPCKSYRTDRVPVAANAPVVDPPNNVTVSTRFIIVFCFVIYNIYKFIYTRNTTVVRFRHSRFVATIVADCENTFR